MTVSTMSQLMISKTKKRLSKSPLLLSAPVIAVAGLAMIASFCLRAITLDGEYGIVRAEIPIVSAPLSPLSPLLNMPGDKLEKNTPLIVLTSNEFFFGTLESFSEAFIQVRDKFRVPHENLESGLVQPRLDKLVSTMEKWDYQRRTTHGIDNNGIAVLLAANEMPLAIVTQVIADLKRTKLYHRVVLASDLL